VALADGAGFQEPARLDSLPESISTLMNLSCSNRGWRRCRRVVCQRIEPPCAISLRLPEDGLESLSHRIDDPVPICDSDGRGWLASSARPRIRTRPSWRREVGRAMPGDDFLTHDAVR
jgi:hypothetical protein